MALATNNGVIIVISADRPETRQATRLAFFAAGFGIACWAPLIPFIKQHLDIDTGLLGLLLLCIGVGSVVAMLVTGFFSARFGSRPIIIAGGLGLAFILPLLPLANSPLILGIMLLAFGAALGSLDVAMNIHAVEVERASNSALMSGFHALFSVGGFLGATFMTTLLSLKLSAVLSSLMCSVLLVLTIAIARPRLLHEVHVEEGHLFVIPRGVVLILSALATVTFLVEGAILDWSALLITDMALLAKEKSGLGYTLFAAAMTIGRFGGDAVTTRIGDRSTLMWGGVIAISGIGLLLFSPVATIALLGFVLIGFGASNIVPVLFRQAGRQRVMPAALAVAAITTTGYAGILLGPAAVGLVAKEIGLQVAFGMMAILLFAVPVFARLVTKPTC